MCLGYTVHNLELASFPDRSLGEWPINVACANQILCMSSLYNTHVHTHAIHAHNTYTHAGFLPYPSAGFSAVVPAPNRHGIHLLECHLVCYPAKRISVKDAMVHEYIFCWLRCCYRGIADVIDQQKTELLKCIHHGSLRYIKAWLQF